MDTGSSKCHDFVGLAADTSLSKPPSLVRADFCFCDACQDHDFDDCAYKRHSAMRRVTTKVSRLW